MTQLASSRQIRLARLSAFYWRATFDHPPLSIFGPETRAIEDNHLHTIIKLDRSGDLF
jgi:hypothetical protein